MKKQKRKNGKAIYQPAGKAGEYGTWGCNFYVGCLNDCELLLSRLPEIWYLEFGSQFEKSL